MLSHECQSAQMSTCTHMGTVSTLCQTTHMTKVDVKGLNKTNKIKQ